MKQANAGEASIDAVEIAKFERLADEWWDPNSKFRPLHKFNPVRLAYIREHALSHFERDPQQRQPLKGLRILDIGCGGGLLCEPMARLGAEVVGADPARTSIEAAKTHAARSGLAIDYRAVSAEALRDAGESFDIVLNMEVVEHVADVSSFMQACCDLVRPNGLMVVATINRTAKAFALAIVAAEYVLRWLPRGTHNYDKLVTPAEVSQALRAGGMRVVDETGVSFNPLTDRWSRSNDMDVNYMVLAHKPQVR